MGVIASETPLNSKHIKTMTAAMAKTSHNSVPHMLADQLSVTPKASEYCTQITSPDRNALPKQHSPTMSCHQLGVDDRWPLLMVLLIRVFGIVRFRAFSTNRVWRQIWPVCMIGGFLLQQRSKTTTFFWFAGISLVSGQNLKETPATKCKVGI